MDFITKLSDTKKGFQDINSIFIIINKYTRMVRFFTVLNILSAIKLTYLFYIKIKLKFKALNNIIFNEGFIFINNF